MYGGNEGLRRRGSVMGNHVEYARQSLLRHVRRSRHRSNSYQLRGSRERESWGLLSNQCSATHVSKGSQDRKNREIQFFRLFRKTSSIEFGHDKKGVLERIVVGCDGLIWRYETMQGRDNKPLVTVSFGPGNSLFEQLIRTKGTGALVD